MRFLVLGAMALVLLVGYPAVLLGAWPNARKSDEDDEYGQGPADAAKPPRP